LIRNRFSHQRQLAFGYSLLFRRLFLKAMSSNQFLPPLSRTSALRALRQTRVHGSNLRNFCRISLRSRAFYRSFSLSRSQIHHFAGFGFLPGVKRTGW